MVSRGVGLHLIPTQIRRKTRGRATKYLQDDWCFGCKKNKTTYVCSVCHYIDDQSIHMLICHAKTGWLCYNAIWNIIIQVKQCIARLGYSDFISSLTVYS